MGGRIMLGAASLAISSLLLLPANTYAAPSLQGEDLEDFQKTEDWDLGPGTRPGPMLSSAKKVYLRAFLKEMRNVADMITSPNWRLKKAKESPLPPSELVVRPSQTLIRSPFGVFRLRPQDPYWVDLMHQVGK